ncbi:MAG TPA: slipin family protein, partial [Ignavibacteriales bacterium]|nr:slipin family protein [Ignavibacteriales bacterium]
MIPAVTAATASARREQREERKAQRNNIEYDSNKLKKGFNPVAFSLFMILAVPVIILLGNELIHPIVGICLLLISALLAASIKIANQWEKAIVLRLGKFAGLKGPGYFFIIPVIDVIDKYIDQRVRVTDFQAETTLTKDTVPVNVDAVVYWTVWDAEKAALEVQDYISAVSYIAQASLRDIIGKHELAELLQNRDKIADGLQKALDEHTNSWGITCQSVGIKDIVIPPDLADAMSKQAQAERERQARIILGTAETEISEKFAQASE